MEILVKSYKQTGRGLKVLVMLQKQQLTSKLSAGCMRESCQRQAHMVGWKEAVELLFNKMHSTRKFWTGKEVVSCFLLVTGME